MGERHQPRLRQQVGHVRAARLPFEDVQAGGVDGAFAQGGQQSGLVDDAAP